MKLRISILIALATVVGLIWFATTRSRRELVLTGIVTTDDVIVGPELQGRVQRLLVKEGDVVRSNDLLALIRPQEWKADMAFYASSELQSAAQVAQAEADLKYQAAQTSNQIWQAEASLAAAEAQVVQAEAERENARLNFRRMEGLYRQGVESAQLYDQARTSFDGAQAHVESLRKQVQAARAAVGLANSTAEQTAARRAALEVSIRQRDAMGAQKDKAQVRLNYTEIRAPMDGIVDVRAAREGEVVSPGQGIVTLIDPDNLWVRTDVEESYIDRIRVGDKMKVRLPSGALREGTVFRVGVDADYATQRDVNRTKRDIRTFEVRLRCDNADRSLKLGLTAYVTLVLGK